MSQPIELHAVVSGTIQGVGFRFKAQKIAERLQITGYVQNLPNGGVEIVAQGPRHILDDFIINLKNLSLPVQIKDLQVTWKKPQKEWQIFHIH